MRKKILIILIIFISALAVSMTASNAATQTLSYLRRLAENDLDGFLEANIQSSTDGSTKAYIDGSRAAYCMDVTDHGKGNR